MAALWAPAGQPLPERGDLLEAGSAEAPFAKNIRKLPSIYRG
jgi:hypothetical protein